MDHGAFSSVTEFPAGSGGGELPVDSTFDLLGSQRPLGGKLSYFIFRVKVGDHGLATPGVSGGLEFSYWLRCQYLSSSEGKAVRFARPARMSKSSKSADFSGPQGPRPLIDSLYPHLPAGRYTHHPGELSLNTDPRRGGGRILTNDYSLIVFLSWAQEICFLLRLPLFSTSWRFSL